MKASDLLRSKNLAIEPNTRKSNK